MPFRRSPDEPGSPPAAWREAPLTPALLASQGVTLAKVSFRMTAVNSKAARRGLDLRFSATAKAACCTPKTWICCAVTASS